MMKNQTGFILKFVTLVLFHCHKISLAFESMHMYWEVLITLHGIIETFVLAKDVTKSKNRTF